MKISARDLFAVLLRSSGQQEYLFSLIKSFFTIHQIRFKGKMLFLKLQILTEMIGKEFFLVSFQSSFFRKNFIVISQHR